MPVQEIQSACGTRSGQILARIDFSLEQRPNLWTYVFLSLGFLARIWHASGTFLNSDEVMHFAAANKTSWLQTYEASLALSHPPLLIFILHLWRGLGTSELVLRMPSILAGMAFCWFTFRWARVLFSKDVGWITYIFVLFLPTSIELSTEIRQYALFLAFAMASAYLLERALAKNSAASILFSGVCLWFAIGSHFSAFLFAPALGIYAIWRMLTEHPRARVVAMWIAGQLVAASLCAFFYVTQIRGLSHYFGGQDATQAWMANSYLGHSYFVPGKVNPLTFIVGRTVGVFQFTFRQLLVGDIAFLFFVAGMFLVFRRRPVSARVTSRQLGTLLLLPFAINCAAAFVRAYPYGGTRHSSFLLPFAIAGVSVTLARLSRSRISLGVAVALLLCLVCRFAGTRKPPFASKDERSSNMHAAMDFIHRLPAAGPIFADAQTSLMLGHYLCNQEPVVTEHSVPGFLSFECAGHRVIASNTKYVFTAPGFLQQAQEMANNYHIPEGSRLWVAQMGWGRHVASDLGNAAMHLSSFGGEIQFFEFDIEQIPDNQALQGK